MAEAGEKPEFAVEIEPRQPAEVSRAVAGLLAAAGEGGAGAWWLAGIADALRGGAGPLVPGSAPDQSGVSAVPGPGLSAGGGAAPLRKSCGTERA